MSMKASNKTAKKLGMNIHSIIEDDSDKSYDENYQNESFHFTKLVKERKVYNYDP